MNPGNYRSITISSALMRLFHRIIARRIKEGVRLSLHQRGFTDSDGTLANTLITQHYIRSRTENRKPFNVLSLDLQKAFDSVNQGSVIRALWRLGVSAHMTTYIKASFNGTTTEIKLGKSVSRKISVHRDVKQGDPLSPILFNAVMDKLLCQLSSLGRGGSLDKDGQIKCPTAASADDIVVFEDQDKHLPLDLALIYAFLAKRGMKLNSGKCSLISGGLVPRAGKIIPRAKPFLNYGGADIRMITDFERAKYLGHQLGASGIRKPTIMNLQKWLNNIARALAQQHTHTNSIKNWLR